MKNVILVGANGGTGREMIPRLLEQADIQLTLFLRQSSRLGVLQDKRLTVVEADARDFGALTTAIRGHDIVISTLDGLDLAQKTGDIIRAMRITEAGHLIAINAGGIYDELPEPFRSWDKKMVGQYHPVYRAAADLIENSELTYTILRPVWLTNHSSEQFQLTHKGEIYRGTETSRASIGRLVANIVRDPGSFACMNLGVSQPGTEGDMPAAYKFPHA